VLIGVAVIIFLFACWQVYRWTNSNSEPFDFQRFMAKEIYKGFHVYTLFFILIILVTSGFYLVAAKL